MGNSYKYSVAGHSFEIELPDGYEQERYLAPYMPFATDDQQPPLISLRVDVVDSLAPLVTGVLKDKFNDEPPYFWLYENPTPQEGMSSWFFGFSYSTGHPDTLLYVSSDFSRAVAYLPSAKVERNLEFALSNSMMLLYAFRTVWYDTLLVHASVIANDGGGYMFLGKSGTGKSTHSRLWLENIHGSELLNDDNPVVRVVGDDVYVYGSPWSGKTPCYKNLALELKSVVRLSQAPYNKITSQSPLHAYASLAPACSCMRWDPASTEALHRTVEKVIMRVPGWHLECLPDADAARLSYDSCHPSND